MKKKDTEKIYTDIDVKIIPKSSRNEILGKGSAVKIKVTSPPVDGKANKAVIALLSKQLNIPKRDIHIISGEKSRNKKIRIFGISITDFSEFTG